MRFIRWIFRSLAAALVAPVLAAAPLLAAGFVAYLAGSSAYVDFAETFFALLVPALATSVLAGLPLHAVLSVVRLRNALLYVLAGVLLAFAAWKFYAADTEATWLGMFAEHEVPQWLALAAYGALAGLLFKRRATARAASRESR